MRRRRNRAALWLAAGLLAATALGWRAWFGPDERLVIQGARILTFASDEAARNAPLADRPDALLVEDGRIAWVGNLSDPELAERAGTARRIDLQGATLMPGFIDAHSHFPAVDLARFGIDLAPPPDGDIASLEVLYARVATAIDALPQSDDSWLLGFDYDEAGLAEAVHPTRAALDRIAPDRPVWLRHRSGHMGVGNSAALAALGVGEQWIAPIGGQASRDADGRLNGLLQENAAPSLTYLLRQASLGARLGALAHARDVYLRAGVTTVQNGHAAVGMQVLLGFAARTGYLPQHVVLWPAGVRTVGGGLVERLLARAAAGLIDGEQVAGGAVKLIVDGSPQGRTAWMREPYLPSPDRPANWRGIATTPQPVLDQLVGDVHRAGRQLALHANGDAAIDAALDALELALLTTPREDHRHLIVHAQTVRTDQLRRMAALGVGASFFVTHVGYWGEWHRSHALGVTRAARISPTAEADASGVAWTLHADTPVTPMRPFAIADAAVTRRLPSGEILGPDQRVSRYRALRALTRDAAWQNGLEADRGTIEVGMRADLIALTEDPLVATELRAVAVTRVWIDGRERWW